MSTCIETLPSFELTVPDIEGLLVELEQYHAIYSPLFARREQREHSAQYLHGLLSDIPRKSVEPMVLHLEGASANAIRSTQHFLSQGAWDDLSLLKQHWREVETDLGEEEGVLLVDGSDFLKQGNDSVGVKRQYCGEVGKTANCQAGVFVGYASRKGSTLLHRCLYLPKEWVEDAAFAQRREACGVPESVTFQTKPALALEMVRQIVEEGSLQSRWLACDEAFGQDPSFLDGVAALGLWYYAEVPTDTRVWQTRPQTAVPPWSGRGRKPTRERLVEGQPEPQTLLELADQFTDADWSCYLIKEGSQGPMVAEFAFRRVVAVRDALPGPQVWAIYRRNPFTQELKLYLSCAPDGISKQLLASMSGRRWPIETCFEDCKQFLGMRDYEVRSWRGWHHHMTLVILAHFFLVRIQARFHDKPRFHDKALTLTIPQVTLMLACILPTRRADPEWVLEVLDYRQRRNHAAYRSHRQRKLRKLNSLKGFKADQGAAILSARQNQEAIAA